MQKKLNVVTKAEKKALDRAKAEAKQASSKQEIFFALSQPTNISKNAKNNSAKAYHGEVFTVHPAPNDTLKFR